jgi:hypothetical protein
MPDHTASHEPELLTITEAAELLRTPGRHPSGTGATGTSAPAASASAAASSTAAMICMSGSTPSTTGSEPGDLDELVVSDNNSSPEIRFAQSARRHRIGRASVRHVLAGTEPTLVTTTPGTDAWLYVGPDECGRELEIIAIEVQRTTTALYLLVIQVMPTQLRG